MIRFHDWNIEHDGKVIARQFDNKTRTLAVAGDLPTGWDWAMIVQVGEDMDIIPLTESNGVLSTVLEEKHLSRCGYYSMQLRGTRGEEKQHTNQISVYIPGSLSGDAKWPVLPTEFSDAEKRILAAREEAKQYSSSANIHAGNAERSANRAKEAAEHYPHIENGTWWVWSPPDGYFIDTGVEARGAAVYYSDQEPSFSYDGHWSDPVTDVNNGGYDLPESAIDSELHPVQERDLILAVGYCWQVDWVDGGYVYLKRLFSMVGPQGQQGPQGEKGEKGVSGVYVGSGEMPEDCNVQIDPNGDTLTEKELVDAVLAAMPVAEGVRY